LIPTKEAIKNRMEIIDHQIQHSMFEESRTEIKAEMELQQIIEEESGEQTKGLKQL
jgi:hypothetical protein